MIPNSISRVAAACLALCLTPSVIAGNLTVPARPADTAPLPAASAGSLTLDLTTAYELAVSRNLELQVGRYDLAAAGAGIITNAGIFDPNLSVNVRGNLRESPTTSQLEGTETRNTTFGLGLSQLIPTGGQMSVSAGGQRSASNWPFTTINPSYGTDVTARFTQPLLDGFGTLVNRSGIVIAVNTRDQSAVNYELQVVRTLYDVETAYWDFVKARDAVAVDEQSLELAQRLLDETDERVNVGTSAPIDLVQSEAGVATRRQDLIVSRNNAGNTQDILKAALGFDDAAEWLLEIDAVEPYATDFMELNLAAAIDTALVNRPEITRQQLVIENTELLEKLARNATLPDLDFEASYGYSGVGGDTLIEDPLTGQVIKERGGWGDSTGQLGDFPHWEMGVVLRVPIGNNDAKGRLAQRRYELDRARIQLAALRQQIIREVRAAVRTVHDGAAAIEAAVASSELARRNLEAEYTKFNNGLSTNYLVLDIQENLAQAQLAELNARILYRKAIAAYFVATGTSLNRLGVTIVDPGAPESPHELWADVDWLRFVDLEDASQRVTQPAAAGAADSDRTSSSGSDQGQ